MGLQTNQILINFTSNFPNLFDNMQKFLPLINHKLREETQNNFYIETTLNGLVYIYEDFQTFFLMNKPYSPEKINRFAKLHKLELDPGVLFNGILTTENFPENGIQFQYEIFAKTKLKIVEMLHSHFKSFLFNDVSIIDDPKFDLVLKIAKFENIVLYNQMVSTMSSGILTDEK